MKTDHVLYQQFSRLRRGGKLPERHKVRYPRKVVNNGHNCSVSGQIRGKLMQQCVRLGVLGPWAAVKSRSVEVSSVSGTATLL